ncbi:MAG: N-acyl homoserine lactonase family protein [Gammaproteobacteria bacterium]
MTAKIFAFECGQLTMPLAIFFEGKPEGTMRAPIPSFLIEHAKGRLLFDTGLNPLTSSDPVTYLGERLASVTQVHLSADETIDKRLESVGIDIRTIDFVVNSHLHFDHCGCNCQACNAQVIVQQPEWDWATQSDDQAGYIKADYETGQDVKAINGEFDIFGDGSVVCFPSYGHTPGHQSLRVRTENGEFVLTGDACYLKKTLDEMALPGVMYDREQTIKSLEVFRRLQANGATIIYGHDPDFWPTLNKAPLSL